MTFVIAVSISVGITRLVTLSAVTIRPGVAAGHPATAAAGADVLRQGGSAVDAAVAMMLVSCAAETIFTGLGGGGFATVWDAAAGEATCVDFFVAVPGLGGRTPGLGEPIEVIFVGHPMPYEIGPPTVAVPGVPAGAHHLWRRWGRLPWADVVAPGLAASYGTPFPRTHAELLPRIAGAMSVGEGARVYGTAADGFLRTGEPLVHPHHHHAYALLAEDPAAFYSGAYADAVVAAMGTTGALDATDLAAYRVVESAPARVPFRGATVLARGHDLDDVLGTFARTSAGVPADPLTDVASARGLVDALRAPDRRAETTNLVAADADGDVAVITTSLGLGSGVWVPGFGVHLNSMLGEGELVRHPLPPGERMGSMMSPLLVLGADGRPVVAAGAAGGSRIRPALVQSVLRMLSGAPAHEAIAAPRLNAVPGAVRVEPGFAPGVLAALADDGDDVFEADGLDAYFGGVSALTGDGPGADPRRDGAVITLNRTGGGSTTVAG